MSVMLVLFLGSILILLLSLVFFIRNNIIFRIRESLRDWIFDGISDHTEDYRKYRERVKILDMYSYNEMLFSPKHIFKWSFESFYEAEVNKQLLKE